MTPTLRISLCFFALEAAFAPLITAAYLAGLDIDQGAATAVGLLVVLQIVRFTTMVIVLARSLRPLERWRALPERTADKDATFAAARAAYRAPYTFAFVYTALWTLLFPLATIILLVAYPERVPLDPHVKPAIVMLGAAVMCGPTAYAFSTVEWLLSKEIRLLSLRLHEDRLSLHGAGMSLSTRFMAFALVCAGASALWLGGIDYLSNARGRSRVLEVQNELATHQLAAAARALDAVTGKAPDPMTLVEARAGAFLLRDAKLQGAGANELLANRAETLQQLQREAARVESGKLHHIQSGIVVSFTRLDPATTIGVVSATDVGVSGSFWWMQIPFFLLIGSWAPISAWLLSRSTVSPIQKLSAVVEDIRHGRVVNVDRVAIYHHDETGKLSANVNGMLDVLHTLSAQARSIGTGDLSTTFSIGGDLGESFRAQLDSLRTIVGHLTQNAVQLSAAASELYAASQEQETAAGHQSAGVNEVGKTMESLLAAAAHISEATQGVLGKAERTRETTDRTAQKIGELSAHAGRIGEILDVIRDIADRSDLLALNASLEGTRAGEAGRGFTLVATEMRKLAERVMASVGDIKQLVADVRSSVASTIMVTEESAKLADGTTESARQISLVTQQQSSGTEQAAQSMRDVAAMLTQSLSATQQMRSLAANLKGQAEQLSTVVARFRITNGVAGSA